ncbi:DUF5683 domain-containing protein [Flavihumibacter sp. CACIAM 22H1]|uniref:DUF5683 domain-containing protein n=1 Tax=Flavihumibacter sp. CACIAM 22H1 TaxID=1812911 RepID=UPI0007A8A2F0|nr:DUF5683 domain-containing protein [Flavihumibacter sp. CACIAM 22H1]KYP13936.1 MAG: hypothetical protein A1D16_19605 [Flavihumibacter sp. CACIAM 22H1]
MIKIRVAVGLVVLAGLISFLPAYAEPLPVDFRFAGAISRLVLENADTIPLSKDSGQRQPVKPGEKPAGNLKTADQKTANLQTADSTSAGKKTKEPHNPRKATIRSAIIPGWGQVYNKKYWKVPIVYAALGITGYVFFDNIKTYREVRFAYKVTAGKDTASWDKVAPYLRVFVENNAVSSLDNYRREFRRNIDYSVLVFLLFWGLNVVDATVDAHLKEFDVSPELSMKLKPLLPNNTYQLGLGNTAGLSLVFDIHKAKPAKLFAK